MPCCSYITGCIEGFSSNVALPPDLVPDEPSCGLKRFFRTIAACILSPELVNSCALPRLPSGHSLTRCANFSFRYLAIMACLRAHRQAREQYDLWAQKECVAVDTCAAYISSLALTERLVQLRLQYDTFVPSITHFARTMGEHATSTHMFSCAVDRWCATGMLHDRDKEAYSVIHSSNIKRIGLCATPPRIITSCLISTVGSRCERNMLRYNGLFCLLMCL